MICLNDELDRIGPFFEEPDDHVVICRCEEITKGEIRKAVHEGIFTIEEMRRALRNGMGLCQGQTCENLVMRLIAGERGIPITELEAATARAPMRPIEMEIFSKDGFQK